MHSSIDHRIPLDQSLEGSEQLSNIYQNVIRVQMRYSDPGLAKCIYLGDSVHDDLLRGYSCVAIDILEENCWLKNTNP